MLIKNTLSTKKLSSKNLSFMQINFIHFGYRSRCHFWHEINCRDNGVNFHMSWSRILNWTLFAWFGWTWGWSGFRLGLTVACKERTGTVPGLKDRAFLRIVPFGTSSAEPASLKRRSATLSTFRSFILHQDRQMVRK